MSAVTSRFFIRLLCAFSRLHRVLFHYVIVFGPANVRARWRSNPIKCEGLQIATAQGHYLTKLEDNLEMSFECAACKSLNPLFSPIADING